jgi:hypothetical protein
MKNITTAYQHLVNEVIKSTKDALDKKDFVLLDQLRVLGGTFISETVENLILAEFLSEEQGLELTLKWEKIEEIIDAAEVTFTEGRPDDAPEDLKIVDIMDVPDTVDEGWGG